jgi:hypothetical protein
LSYPGGIQADLSKNGLKSPFWTFLDDRLSDRVSLFLTFQAVFKALLIFLKYHSPENPKSTFERPWGYTGGLSKITVFGPFFTFLSIFEKLAYFNGYTAIS